MIGGEGQGRSLGALAVTGLSFLLLLFLLAPVVIIVAVSFGASEYMVFPPRQLSLRWYRDVVGDAQWLRAGWVSAQVATIATVTASLVVIPASLALTRARVRYKTFAYSLMLSPLIVPVIITAIGLYFFFARIFGTGSVVAMGLGHAVLSVPVMTIIITAAMQGIDPNLDDAAFSLGASHLYTLRRVTLPLIAPAIVAAFLFAFLMSLDELLIPLFLSGIRVQTLSVKIWQSIQYELSPAIAAVSSILIAATLLVLGITTVVRRPAIRRDRVQPDP